MSGPGPHSSRHLLAWAGGCLHRSSAFSAACRLLFWGMLLLAAMVAYCWIFGLPSRVTRVLAERMGDRTHAVRVRQVWIDPLQGIRASGLALVPRSDTNRPPPLQAEDVTLRLNWRNVVGGGPWLRSVALRGGIARLQLPPDFAADDGSRDFVVSNVAARLSLAWNLFRVERLDGTWPGGRIHIAGQLLNRSANTNGGALWEDWFRVQDALGAAPEPVRELYRHLAKIELAEPIDLNVQFRHHTERPELGTVRIDAHGGRAVSRGLDVDGWTVRATLDAKQCDLPEVTLSAAGRRCRIDARLDLDRRTMRLHAVNELPPDYWQNLLPASWASELSALSLRLEGPVQSEFWIDETPWPSVGSSWRGRIAWGRADFHGIRLSEASLDIRREPDRIAITNAVATVGTGPSSGPLRGSLQVDLLTGNMDCRLEAKFDPHQLDPIMPHGTARFLQRIQFDPQTPPTFDGGFTVNGPSNETLVVRGALDGRDLVYRDVPLTRLHTDLTYSNGMLNLDAFRMDRTNGHAKGWLALDLHREIYAFDLTGDTDPLSVGLIVSPHLHQALGRGRYNGPATMRAWGVYDTHHPEGTDLKVQVDARDVGLSRLHADRASFLVENRGHRYSVTNLVAESCGGALSARVFLYPATSTNGGERFEIELKLVDADLPRLVRMLGTTTNTPPTGIVNLELSLAGLLDAADLGGLRGEGHLAVTNGQLHKARLFGGLSSLLSTLSPDLGYASQTELDLPFTIADGRLHSPKVLLGGEWVSAKGKGSYNLLDRQLDYLVEVQLLKKGLVADAVRLITLPVTKLFQIQLKGTLEKPEWRTANLPGIF